MINYACDLARKDGHVLSWELGAPGFTSVSENLFWVSRESSLLWQQSRLRNGRRMQAIFRSLSSVDRDSWQSEQSSKFPL